MERDGRLVWRDTARMPALWGFDVRLLLVSIVPVVSPVAKAELAVVCFGGVAVWVAIEAWTGLGVEEGWRWLRARAAGRRRAVSGRLRPVLVRAGW